MTISRRTFLAALLAGMAAGKAGAAEALTVRHWASGSDRLAPLGTSGGLIMFAGDHTLGVLAPEEAQTRWVITHHLDGGAVFRPRAAGDMLVAGGRREIACWGLADGRARWRYRARVQSGVPLLTGERTFLGDGHEVVALENGGGEPLWRFAGVPDTLLSYAPVLAGDTLFAGPGDGRLYALAATDGTPRWVVDRGGAWQYLRQLHVSGPVLVAGSYTERLYGLSLADGSLLWSFNAGNFINSHHVAGDTAYLWSPTGWVYAIDTTSGAVRWRHRTTDYRGTAGDWAPVMAELATDEAYLYALAMDDVLHVLARANGEEVARIALPEALRPCVLPLPGRGLALASADGDILLLPPHRAWTGHPGG